MTTTPNAAILEAVGAAVASAVADAMPADGDTLDAIAIGNAMPRVDLILEALAIWSPLPRGSHLRLGDADKRGVDVVAVRAVSSEVMDAMFGQAMTEKGHVVALSTDCRLRIGSTRSSSASST